MLLWAGSYKMTAPGAEGIIPLVSNSPLISWYFKLFGPYLGSDLIGLTEWTAAILISIGYLKPKAGIIGGFIAAVMFLTTSSMLITTLGSIIAVHGIIRITRFCVVFIRVIDRSTGNQSGLRSREGQSGSIFVFSS